MAANATKGKEVADVGVEGRGVGAQMQHKIQVSLSVFFWGPSLRCER